jgi:hypothetical protein
MPDDKRILRPNNEKFFEILQQSFDKLHRPISIGLG